MKQLVRFVIVTLVIAAGTWVAGWWAVPAIALAAGIVRVAPGIVATAAAAAWLVLLLIDVAAASFGRVTEVLAGLLGLPAAALFAVTIAFPALLGWSAASVGDTARSIIGPASSPRRQAPPSHPPPES